MSKVATLQIVSDVSFAQDDTVLSSKFYDDVILDLSKEQWFVQLTILPGIANQATYTLPDEAINLLSVFYDDRILFPATERELEVDDPNWRDIGGTPIAFTAKNEQDRTFRLYPTPDIPGKDFIFFLGSPLGANFPAYSVAVLHTKTVLDVPEWLNLPVAFAILEKEFSRESSHRDAEFSRICSQISKLLFSFLR